MTDHDLEQRLHAWYRAEIDDRESAPLQLRTDLSMLPQTAARSRWTTGGWKFPSTTFIASFGFTATAVVVALLIGMGVIVRTPDVGPIPVPSPTRDATPVATAAPAAAAWTATGSMIETRSRYTATLLANGKVLVAGGSAGNGKSPASAELYDPATGAWTSTGAMLEAWPEAPTATRLADGKVLIAGGWNGHALASAEVYDPSSGTWTATGSMDRGRFYHTATLLPDGTVLVAGGVISNNLLLPSAELYDPRTGSWTATGRMVGPFSPDTATLLLDGTVLAVGGMDDGRGLASAELYDPRTGTWSVTGSLSGANAGRATLLPDGKVLVAGGDSSVLVVQPDTGGPGPDALTLASAELYDPGTGSWTVIGSMTEARAGYTATLLTDGTVLVAGGHRNDTSGTRLLASAELFDPGSGSWTVTRGMFTARAGHTATLLPDGTVLVTGGSDSNLVELYAPGSDS
jgi:WD40 repeat protein